MNIEKKNYVLFSLVVFFTILLLVLIIYFAYDKKENGDISVQEKEIYGNVIKQ